MWDPQLLGTNIETALFTFHKSTNKDYVYGFKNLIKILNSQEEKNRDLRRALFIGSTTVDSLVKMPVLYEGLEPSSKTQNPALLGRYSSIFHSFMLDFEKADGKQGGTLIERPKPFSSPAKRPGNQWVDTFCLTPQRSNQVHYQEI